MPPTLASALQREDTLLDASEMFGGLLDFDRLDSGEQPTSRPDSSQLDPKAAALPNKRKGRQKRATSSCRFNWLRGRATSGTCSCGNGALNLNALVRAATVVRCRIRCIADE